MLLIDLIFPPRCIFCRTVVRMNSRHVCSRCSQNLPLTINGGRMEGEHFYACIAPFYYEGKVRDALIRYKFNGLSSYAPELAVYVSECISSNYGTDFDLISWVPLSRERLKQRGYDQAELLAKHTAEMLGKETVRVLNKIQDRPQQSRAGNAANRRNNIAGAYQVPDPALIAGKRIVLIDDIVTTGSTFSECAKMLMQAGAASVLCAAAAKSKDE